MVETACDAGYRFVVMEVYRFSEFTAYLARELPATIQRSGI
jgi:hypothetical protein